MKFYKPIMQEGIIKRILLSLALVLSLVSAGVAQNFGGGYFGGLTASQIDGDNMGGYDLPGVNVGFFTDLDISENSRLQMELAFIQKGSREPISDSSNFIKYRLNYVEIPLLYAYRLNDFSFEAGPALDINVYAKEEGAGRVAQTSRAFNRFSLTAILGVTWHFSESWAINFRSNNSVTPISPPNVLPSENSSIYQRVLGNGWRNVVLSFAIVHDFSGS